MQQTIMALSQEVENLSSKNIEFLNDLKKNDSFYNSYRETMDELNKLREAHGILISMIKNHHIQIEDESLIQYGSQISQGKQHIAETTKPKLTRSIRDAMSCCAGTTQDNSQEIYLAVAPMKKKRINNTFFTEGFGSENDNHNTFGKDVNFML